MRSGSPRRPPSPGLREDVGGLGANFARETPDQMRPIPYRKSANVFWPRFATVFQLQRAQGGGLP